MPSLFAAISGSTEGDLRQNPVWWPDTVKTDGIFINLQEIKGIRFGTRTPINYFDNFYNAELFLRRMEPIQSRLRNSLKFYSEVIPRMRITLK